MKQSAGVAVFFEEGDDIHILLVHPKGQDDAPWSLPKGEFKEDDEIPHEAAIRELQEEVGIEIYPDNLITLGTSVYKSRRKKVWAYGWQAKYSIPTNIDDIEVDKAEFFPSDKARELLHDGQKVFVDRLLYNLK